ncbi:MAG: oligosaccharide flippase family protein [Candidatus Micrarchaeota archaeon]
MTSETDHNSWELAKGSFWGMLGNLLFSLLSFIYAFFIARAFPPDSVGLFYLGISFITALGFVTDFGVSVAINRYTPFFVGKGEGGKLGDLVKFGLLLNLVSGALFTALVYSQADALSGLYNAAPLADVLKLLSPLLLFNNLLAATSAYLRGRTDMKFLAIQQNVQNGLKLLLTLGLFFLMGTSVAILCVALLSSVILTVLLSSLRVRSSISALPEPEAPLGLETLFFEMLPLCFTIAAMGWISILLNSSAQILLAIFTDPAFLGATIAAFAMAINLGAVLQIIPNSLTAIALPTITRLYAKGDLKGVASSIMTVQRWGMLILVPVAAVMAIFSDHALVFLFGETYGKGAFVLSAYAVSLVPQTLFSIILLTFIAKMEARIMFSFTLLGCLLGLSSSVLLIPAFGIDGAAVSSLASFCIMLPAMHHLSVKRQGFGVSGGALRILAVGAALLISLSLIKPLIGPYAGSIYGSVISQPAGVLLSPFFYLAYFSALFILSFSISVPLFLALHCFGDGDAKSATDALRRIGAPSVLIRAAEKAIMLGTPHGAG